MSRERKSLLVQSTGMLERTRREDARGASMTRACKCFVSLELNCGKLWQEMGRKSQSGWLECIFMQVEARIVGMLLMPSVPIVISSSTDRSLHFLSSVCTSTRADPPSVPHLQIVAVLCHNHCTEPLQSLSPSHCNFNSGHRHGFFLPAALVLIAPSLCSTFPFTHDNSFILLITVWQDTKHFR